MDNSESITTVPEKAVAYEELASLAYNGAWAGLIAVVASIFALIIYNMDLITLSGGKITWIEVNAVLARSPSANMYIFGLILIAGLAYAACIFLRQKMNKESGIIWGIYDIEIAMHEQAIKKLREKNRRHKARAVKEIESIDGIEKKAAERDALVDKR